MFDSDYDSSSASDGSPQCTRKTFRMSPSSAMNPQASSFSPSSPAAWWAAPPRSDSFDEPDQYSPDNPYRHTASNNSPGSPIVVIPKVYSPQDIHEYQRSPTGNVITTAGGQKVEFWEGCKNTGNTGSANPPSNRNRVHSHNRPKRNTRRGNRRHHR